MYIMLIFSYLGDLEEQEDDTTYSRVTIANWTQRDGMSCVVAQRVS